MTNNKQIKLAKQELEQIKLKLRSGVNYDVCFEKAKQPLAILNARGQELAKEFGVKFRPIGFSAYMR